MGAEGGRSDAPRLRLVLGTRSRDPSRYVPTLVKRAAAERGAPLARYRRAGRPRLAATVSVVDSTENPPECDHVYVTDTSVTLSSQGVIEKIMRNR